MSNQMPEAMKALANLAGRLIADQWKRVLDKASTNHSQGESLGSPGCSQPDCVTSDGGSEPTKRSAKGGEPWQATQ